MEEKEKFNFNLMSRMMANISPRIQYESSLVSASLILIGLLVMIGVTILGTDLAVFTKIMITISGCAGFVFLSSNLITTFQQYQSHLRQEGLMIEDDD